MKPPVVAAEAVERIRVLAAEHHDGVALAGRKRRERVGQRLVDRVDR